jgi:hypothetical protein
MGLIAKKCFTNATRVTDLFHVQKLALQALQEIRIIYRWQAIDHANEAKKLKHQIKIPLIILTNGNTLSNY